jgi:hypothetical protein
LNREVERRNQVGWRRDKILELTSKGYISQRDIATQLHVSIATVNRDIEYLREKARENLESHISKTLPHEYQKCMRGINDVLAMAWNIASRETADDKTKLQAWKRSASW